MAANADMMGAAAVGATKNFQAAIEKERNAVGTWWQNWGFLAKAEGPNPSQLNEYIAMMEARYAELKKEKPVDPNATFVYAPTPGYTTSKDLLGVGTPIEFGPQKPTVKSKDLMPSNPYY